MKEILLFVIGSCVIFTQGIRQGNLILGRSVTLYCPVKTKGMDFTVKSITWTKDGKIFYKYEPSLSNYAISFSVDGVEIEEDAYFNGTRITIGPTTARSAGMYTCNAELNNPHVRGFKFSLNLDTELSFSKMPV